MHDDEDVNEDLLFPAHAGVIPDGSALFFLLIAIPRTRGGDPLWAHFPLCIFCYSPHTRG